MTMVEHSIPIRQARAPRLGRPDGTSEQGVYVARWVDEDTGPHTATVQALSEQAVRDQLEVLVASNTLTIRRVS
jgi:hypothetical protein